MNRLCKIGGVSNTPEEFVSLIRRLMMGINRLDSNIEAIHETK